VSGMAAAGKTKFAEWLSQEICIPLLSLDELWEKVKTTNIPFAQYWIQCDDLMKHSSPLIIEFGFWDEQKPFINELVEKYSYKTINVRFCASMEEAHRRFNFRRVHDMGGSKPQIALEQYLKIVKQSKDFQFGNNIIHVDTTDFSKVSYAEMLKCIQQFVVVET
jgi:hypothetical protein